MTNRWTVEEIKEFLANETISESPAQAGEIIELLLGRLADCQKSLTEIVAKPCLDAAMLRPIAKKALVKLTGESPQRGKAMPYTEQDLQKMLTNPHVKEHGKSTWRESGVTVASLPPGAQAVKGEGKNRGKMTGAEREAGNMLQMEFAGCRIIFHGLAFYLENNHRYTADWCVHLPDGILVVEVKQEGRNGFKQQSYRSARIMFDQTMIEWPEMRFRWMEKTKAGWEIKDY